MSQLGCSFLLFSILIESTLFIWVGSNESVQQYCTPIELALLLSSRLEFIVSKIVVLPESALLHRSRLEWSFLELILGVSQLAFL